MFGMTCDGADVICENFEFNNQVDVGDWLCFGGMGAYTITAKSRFNGMDAGTKIHVCDVEIQNNKKCSFPNTNEKNLENVSDESVV